MQKYDKMTLKSQINIIFFFSQYFFYHITELRVQIGDNQFFNPFQFDPIKLYKENILKILNYHKINKNIILEY